MAEGTVDTVPEGHRKLRDAIACQKCREVCADRARVCNGTTSARRMQDVNDGGLSRRQMSAKFSHWY